MLASVALMLWLGLIANKLVSKLRLPGILGMVAVGVVFGPYLLNIFDARLLDFSQELRSLALIVILLRAGLGLKRDTLHKVGSVALRLSVIPCIFEGLTVMLISRWLLGFGWIEAGMLGFILAAVSPAVIVPAMLELKEEGYGEDKEVPTLILAGASVDDVIAITMFTAFLGMGLQDGSNPLLQLLHIPLSILLAVTGGLLIGIVLFYIYRLQRIKIRNTEKLLMLISASILYFHLGELVGIAGLLGVMTIGFIILERCDATANRFSRSLNRVWVFAEIFLFVLIGAAVDIQVALSAGLTGAAIIFTGLIARSIGVWLATSYSNLGPKERLFCIISYLPKATVQAAIGAIPLSLGFPGGPVILAIAVLAIILTAPLGAIGIKLAAPALLPKDNTQK